MDLASFVSRKNPEAVLEAFARAYAEMPQKPQLVLKLNRGPRRERVHDKLLAAAAKHPGVVVIDRVLSADRIDELQWCCDLFLSLHRSEGFGLWIAECMAKGKPCVVTSYSGNTDFTNSENSVGIGFSMIPVGRAEYPMGEGNWWADPDVDEAAGAICELSADAKARRAIGAAARSTISTQLSVERIGRLIRERLHQARAEALDLPALELVG